MSASSSPFWRLWRKLLFTRDAEKAHESVLRAVRIAKDVAPWALRLMSGVGTVSSTSGPAPEVFGMPFLSRAGLAAGFDKNAEILDALPDLGFGFAEIGTVTPRPQQGNERPRLFRNVQARTVFNRMGFNNDGAETIARRVGAVRPMLPDLFRVGVNVGKNKDTPAEDAHHDYAKAARPFVDSADFFVVNVSSPNTPGLRALQTEEALKRILDAILGVASRPVRSIPVLVKLAPEVEGAALRDVITAGDRFGVSGWVLTNTLGGTWSPPATGSSGTGTLQGGWSGACLTVPSRERLLEARGLTLKPIISVGGIMSEVEALRRRQMGADLIEAYSGWIYEGPGFPARLARALTPG